MQFAPKKKEYTRTFKVLLNDAPRRPFSDVEKVFLEEFGKKPQEMFVQENGKDHQSTNSHRFFEQI
jgi:hypothetical protein